MHEVNVKRDEEFIQQIMTSFKETFSNICYLQFVQINNKYFNSMLIIYIYLLHDSFFVQLQ